MYWRTAESMVGIWARSETFEHGFLILPISLFLIWTRRREVAKLVPAPDYLGFVLVAGAGLVWLIAAAGQVQVVQQYAMVAMIPAAVIALAGREVAWALAFPLAFLLLAVPIGEALVPPLMDWTADFTVAALQLTGDTGLSRRKLLHDPVRSVVGRGGLQRIAVSDRVDHGGRPLRLPQLPETLEAIAVHRPFGSSSRSWPTGCAPT